MFVDRGSDLNTINYLAKSLSTEELVKSLDTTKLVKKKLNDAPFLAGRSTKTE